MSEPQDDSTPKEPVDPPASIQSRFLFVDVAAQRAKQLRRGARVRLTSAEERHPHKLERAAMEEVRQRLIHYELPDLPTSK
jgi:DNA-directed RNA polymerase subunit K/omega